MDKIRLGVICPSEIAFRRFMPALKTLTDEIEYVGVAHASKSEWVEDQNSDKLDFEKILNNDLNKAQKFAEEYGGLIFNSYRELITSNKVDAIYMPLPPALHYKWANEALLNNKHVFLEKPSTTSFLDTKQLVDIALKNKLALHENYMFIFHNQLDYIKKIIDSNELGEIRLYRIAFGFPFRGTNDFRYSGNLGGGALLDCGGYTLKLASYLLGDSCRLIQHKLNYKDGIDVDLYGSGVLTNDNGEIAQVAFGMDNSYKCELEVWGSKGCLKTNRILTAPVGYAPIITISSNEGARDIKLDSDDSFKKSIEFFVKCIKDNDIKNKNYNILLKQSKIVDEFKE